MGSAQAGVYHGTQDAQGGKHSFAPPRPTDTTSRNCQVLQEDPIEVDESSYMSPEIRALLSQDAQQTHLEVDEDADEEADDEPSARSVYAMSMYPGVGPSFQVEEYENGQDSATM